MIAEWVLQPGFELTEDTTEIPISVNVPFGIGVPNGEGTLFGPIVFEADDTVRVIVVLLDFPNDGMAGLIVDGLPVTLDRPLGDREVEGASPTLADKADIYAEPMG